MQQTLNSSPAGEYGTPFSKSLTSNASKNTVNNDSCLSLE